MTERIDQTFSSKDTVFVAYMMGGDPDLNTSQSVMNAMPDNGVDIIELGMPFTDPAADGPVIEEAGLRSLAAGTTLTTILDMAAEFRRVNNTTPIIVMGYCNPVHHMGYSEFAKRAKACGVDGAIIVDLPPEEDAELRTAFEQHDLALIRLATPTTDDIRLPRVVAGTKGFVYYASVAGITGKELGQQAAVSEAFSRIRKASSLPVVVGFGIKTPGQAAKVAKDADGVVVGSAIVKELFDNGPDAALKLTKSLAEAVRNV